MENTMVTYAKDDAWERYRGDGEGRIVSNCRNRRAAFKSVTSEIYGNEQFKDKEINARSLLYKEKLPEMPSMAEESELKRFEENKSINGYEEIGCSSSDHERQDFLGCGSKKFTFQRRCGKLNLRSILKIDVEKLERDVDIPVLQNHLDNFALADLACAQIESLSPKHLQKLFRISQLMIEYLSFIQSSLLAYSQSLEEELSESRNEQKNLRKKSRAQSKELKALKKDLKLSLRAVKTYEVLLSQENRIVKESNSRNIPKDLDDQRVVQNLFLDLTNQIRMDRESKDSTQKLQESLRKDIGDLHLKMIQEMNAQREALEDRAKALQERETSLESTIKAAEFRLKKMTDKVADKPSLAGDFVEDDERKEIEIRQILGPSSSWQEMQSELQTFSNENQQLRSDLSAVLVVGKKLIEQQGIDTLRTHNDESIQKGIRLLFFRNIKNIALRKSIHSWKANIFRQHSTDNRKSTFQPTYQWQAIPEGFRDIHRLEIRVNHSGGEEGRIPQTWILFVPTSEGETLQVRVSKNMSIETVKELLAIECGRNVADFELWSSVEGPQLPNLATVRTSNLFEHQPFVSYSSENPQLRTVPKLSNNAANTFQNHTVEEIDMKSSHSESKETMLTSSPDEDEEQQTMTNLTLVKSEFAEDTKSVLGIQKTVEAEIGCKTCIRLLKCCKPVGSSALPLSPTSRNLESNHDSMNNLPVLDKRDIKTKYSETGFLACFYREDTQTARDDLRLAQLENVSPIGSNFDNTTTDIALEIKAIDKDSEQSVARQVQSGMDLLLNRDSTDILSISQKNEKYTPVGNICNPGSVRENTTLECKQGILQSQQCLISWYPSNLETRVFLSKNLKSILLLQSEMDRVTRQKVVFRVEEIDGQDLSMSDKALLPQSLPSKADDRTEDSGNKCFEPTRSDLKVHTANGHFQGKDEFNIDADQNLWRGLSTKDENKAFESQNLKNDGYPPFFPPSLHFVEDNDHKSNEAEEVRLEIPMDNTGIEIKSNQTIAQYDAESQDLHSCESKEEISNSLLIDSQGDMGEILSPLIPPDTWFTRSSNQGKRFNYQEESSSFHHHKNILGTSPAKIEGTEALKSHINESFRDTDNTEKIEDHITSEYLEMLSRLTAIDFSSSPCQVNDHDSEFRVSQMLENFTSKLNPGLEHISEETRTEVESTDIQGVGMVGGTDDHSFLGTFSSSSQHEIDKWNPKCETRSNTSGLYEKSVSPPSGLTSQESDVVGKSESDESIDGLLHNASSKFFDF